MATRPTARHGQHEDDGNNKNSVASVNTITDEYKFNFTASVHMVADENKINSTASVDAVPDDTQTTTNICVKTWLNQWR